MISSHRLSSLQSLASSRVPRVSSALNRALSSFRISIVLRGRFFSLFLRRLCSSLPTSPSFRLLGLQLSVRRIIHDLLVFHNTSRPRDLLIIGITLTSDFERYAISRITLPLLAPRSSKREFLRCFVRSAVIKISKGTSVPHELSKLLKSVSHRWKSVLRAKTGRRISCVSQHA